jgi:hypothetical protein
VSTGLLVYPFFDDASLSAHDLRFDEIVERRAEAAGQWPVAASYSVISSLLGAPADRPALSASLRSRAPRGSVNWPRIISLPSGRLPTMQQYSSDRPLGSLTAAGP